MGDGTGNGAEAVPPEVGELQQACLRYVNQAIGTPLDGTPDTLPILDHYLREMPKGRVDELDALVLPAAGAYFGEVVRTSLGDCSWIAPPGDYDAWRLAFARCSLRFNPIGVVYEVVNRSGSTGVFELDPTDRLTAAERLEAFSAVDLDDYYRLTVRFETLEQIVILLSEPEP